MMTINVALLSPVLSMVAHGVRLWPQMLTAPCGHASNRRPRPRIGPCEQYLSNSCMPPLVGRFERRRLLGHDHGSPQHTAVTGGVGDRSSFGTSISALLCTTVKLLWPAPERPVEAMDNVPRVQRRPDGGG